jgi:hypothetical protein
VVNVEHGDIAFAWIGNASAIVEDARGRLQGVLAVSFRSSTPDDVLFTNDVGVTRWTTKIAGYGEDLAVLPRNGSLVVTRWDLISSGSSLVALDEATGKLSWTADVEQLWIPHSKYHNEVELRARGDDVVMIGHESGGSYVQIFDAASGARRFSDLLK